MNVCIQLMQSRKPDVNAGHGAGLTKVTVPKLARIASYEPDDVRHGWHYGSSSCFVVTTATMTGDSRTLMLLFASRL